MTTAPHLSSRLAQHPHRRHARMHARSWPLGAAAPLRMHMHTRAPERPLSTSSSVPAASRAAVKRARGAAAVKRARGAAAEEEEARRRAAACASPRRVVPSREVRGAPSEDPPAGSRVQGPAPSEEPPAGWATRRRTCRVQAPGSRLGWATLSSTCRGSRSRRRSVSSRKSAANKCGSLDNCRGRPPPMLTL